MIRLDGKKTNKHTHTHTLTHTSFLNLGLSLRALCCDVFLCQLFGNYGTLQHGHTQIPLHYARRLELKSEHLVIGGKGGISARNLEKGKGIEKGFETFLTQF